ncbi:hypothetical protein HDU98_004757, partial [Podochytrium sp. JEL0797]
RELEAKLAAETQEKEEAYGMLSSMKVENEALEERVDELDAQLFNEQQSLECMEAERDEYRSETEYHRKSLKAMEVQIEGLGKEMGYWKTEWRSARADVASDVEEKQEEVDGLRRELGEVLEEKEELAELVDMLEEEKEEVVQMLRWAERGIATLQEKDAAAQRTASFANRATLLCSKDGLGGSMRVCGCPRCQAPKRVREVEWEERCGDLEAEMRL